ncbi:MAG: hypothetical protein ABSF83_00235 [Nitrososphaerales archaeon]
MGLRSLLRANRAGPLAAAVFVRAVSFSDDFRQSAGPFVVVGFVVIGLVALFAREVIGKRMDVKEGWQSRLRASSFSESYSQRGKYGVV